MFLVRYCEFPTTVFFVASVLDQNPVLCVPVRLHVLLFLDQGINCAIGKKGKRELQRTE